MKLITDEINNQLDELIGKCFTINRMLDRGMSLLKVRWKLIRTSDILHAKVAHAYPLDKFADGISEYQSIRGNETIYPSTPYGNREYENPLNFFEDYLRENLELENMIKDTIDNCDEIGDINTKLFLYELLKNLEPFMALSMDLIDIIKNYGNDIYSLQLFDSVIDKYITI